MDPIVVEVLVSVAKTFAVMAVGAGFRRLWTRDVSTVNDLAMHLFVPCLAFSAVVRAEVSPIEFGTIAAAAAIVLAGGLVLALAAIRLTQVDRRGLILPIVFMNSANLPFPILEANYGDTGLGYGVIFYLVVQTVLFSVGILLVTRSTDLRALLRTPVFIATVLAIIVKATAVEPPRLIMDTTELLGGAAIPIILFTFGYSLAGVRSGAWRLTALAAILRLGGGFALGLMAVSVLGIEGLLREVVLVDAAMPSAVITVAVAARYRTDPELVASTVFVTTAAAVVILPVLLIWLRTSA